MTEKINKKEKKKRKVNKSDIDEVNSQEKELDTFIHNMNCLLDIESCEINQLCSENSSEQNLCVGLISGAIDDITTNYHTTTDNQEELKLYRKRAKQAYYWVIGRETETGLFTFEFCCLALDVSVNRWRKLILDRYRREIDKLLFS